MRKKWPRIKVGSVFERLTVVAKAEKVNYHTAWVCRCICGKERTILSQSLKTGSTRSCGCILLESIIGRKFKHAQKAKEALGKVFGKWTVLDLLDRRGKNGGVYFLCRCECGNEREVASDGLFRGASQGCRNCGKQRSTCKYGHVVLDWGGRTPSGCCKACLKDRHMMRNYGITLNEYVAIGEFQNWKCAICGRDLVRIIEEPGFGGTSLARPELDHEHTGKKSDTPNKKYVRGILCGGRWAGCNRKLGRIDNIKWLSNVLGYLKNPPAQNILKSEKSKSV